MSQPIPRLSPHPIDSGQPSYSLRSRVRRLLSLFGVAVLLAALAVAVPSTAAPENLAAGQPVTASSHTDVYMAAHAVDGSQATYWESANHAFPQWLRVDLGAETEVDRVVLKLPTSGWEARTQTLEIQGSADGSTYSTLAASGQHVFDPASGNTVEVTFDATTTRYVRVLVTANTGWPAAQLSELGVYGPDGGDPDPDPDPEPPEGTELAAGRPIDASSTVHVFEAANANDGDVTTYWEGAPGAYPSTLTVDLGANSELEQIVLKLNPDPAWGPRTQTLTVLGRDQETQDFSTVVGEASYQFDPATSNTVTIPVTATAADVRLRFTGNSGAPNGQVAELQVFGTPAPNPDLKVTDMAWTPASPSEVDDVTLDAMVTNAGDRPSAATTVEVQVDGEVIGSADVGELAAGASATVSVDAGPLAAGSHEVGAVVDPDDQVVEKDDANNGYQHPDALAVTAIQTSDLVASAVTWTPDNPASGDTVTFVVRLANAGSIASAAGPHGITLTVRDADGQVVRTLTGSHDGAIAAGDTAPPVTLGTWTTGDGRYTVTTEIEPDANEHAVKRDNNTSSTPFFVGRGANMPFDMYEAEDGVVGGGAQVVGPNRTIGDVAGEASGRRAVTLDSTGEYVEFTTTADTNTLVTRFSIPDAPGGGGITETLNVYVDGEFLQPLTLTSRFAWLYGDEASPANSPSQGPPRHIYDEANVVLDSTIPAGSTIRLQKDTANGAAHYAIDFIALEQVSPDPNPDPERYVEPDGFTHQDVQNALDQVRMDTSGQLDGVYLPPGDYQTAQKFQVYGRPIEVLGAGPWFTRFHAPQDQENTDVGFRAESSANGSTFSGFAYFGNYTTRIDGPGKVFDLQNVADMTIDNIWVEHMVCLYWGANTDNMTITNSRARNLFADVLNMTNGSSNNLVSNIDSRASGDDSFALFAATDAGGGAQTGNVYENLTSILTWRAAGLAVYGGEGNTFRDIYIADTLVYSGITISSLNFGYSMDGFGTDPTHFENISIVRAGGHFWGGQTFPGIWLFSASEEFQGIRIDDVDIVDPTYAGIMFQTQYVGGQPVNPITDTVLTDVTISGAQLSGDEFNHKSGIGIWANEMPEQGQGPAVGSAIFNNLRLVDNHEDIRNTTDTFDIVINE